ncbi:hypothetical protein V5799_026871 [Amblyomma americanum]|uniref:Uncharacterized protein n=1 Tax=Amblyomma americanum TaxID=6943 RepID=A0AAQ4DHD4_AMBAM
MKIALALVLFLEAACTVRAQMNPLGSGLQRLLVGVLGARGGGRYGNPGAAYVHQGGAAAVPQANVRQQAYAGYAPAANGRVQSRPMFGTGLLSFGAGRRGAVSGARAPGRRWRRQASAYPEDLLTRGFNIVRRLDGDRCILRACCEAAAKPGEYGDEGQLAVQFILICIPKNIVLHFLRDDKALTRRDFGFVAVPIQSKTMEAIRNQTEWNAYPSLAVSVTMCTRLYMTTTSRRLYAPCVDHQQPPNTMSAPHYNQQSSGAMQVMCLILSRTELRRDVPFLSGQSLNAATLAQWESLEVTAFLALVTASHTSGSLLRRSIFRFCSKHGLEIHALYFYLACLAYVLAVFVHKSLVAVLFVLTVDKLLGFVHECELDKSLIGERSDQ